MTNSILQSSAFDSFAQAVESMFSVKSTSESLSNSKKSIKFFLANYKNFISNKNLENAFSYHYHRITLVKQYQYQKL